MSFNSLQDEHDQSLFLHIACFFIGKEKDTIVRILDACDFYTTVGLQNLIDRYLVRIEECNKVKMHHMIRDMGREIVRLESKDPEKRSRLWNCKDSLNVLREKTVRNNTSCSSFSVSSLFCFLHLYSADLFMYIFIIILLGYKCN